MYIGKICGVRLILNRWFLLLVVLFGAGGMLKEVFIVFSSVLLHEAAHGFIAEKLGYPVREIELLPFGGVARIERLQDAGRRQSILIAAAGPVCSLFVALLCFGTGSDGQDTFITLLVQVNVMLGLFNLLPAFPLDGGHILHALLRGVTDYRRAAMPAIYLSYIVAALLSGKVVYDFIFSHSINFSLLILAVFIVVSARKEAKGLEFHAVRIMAYKKADLARKGFMESQQYTALKTAKVKDFIHQCKADRYALITIVDETHHVCGLVTEIELWEALVKNGVSIRFSELLPAAH